MSILRLNKRVSFVAALFLTLAATNLNAGQCDRRAFNIKVNDAVSLNEMLNQLSSMCQFSVVAADGEASKILQESINGVNIQNLTLTEILNLLLREKNLSYQFNGKILKVSALSTRTFKLDYITSVREGTAITKASVDSSPSELGESTGKEGGLGETSGVVADNRIATVEKFDFWLKIKDEVKAVLNNGMENFIAPDPVVNSNAGLVTVTGTPAQIRRVENYINSMQNSLKKQVLLDVNIVSVELSNDYSTGVDWSKFQLGFNTFVGSTSANGVLGNISKNIDVGFRSTQPTTGGWVVGGGFNFNTAGMVNFLETKGKTKIIQSPKVMTMNNQQALITVGDNVNYNLITDRETDDKGKVTETKKQYSVFIGILLNILPQISDDNKIMLRINPSLSQFKWAEDNARLPDREISPDTFQKKLSTVVEVNDGDTVIIGGLIGQTKSKDNNGIPVLSSVPLIGNLFKSSKDMLSTTELIFVVTPHIIDLTKAGGLKDSLKQLGYSKSIYGDNE